MGEVVFLHHPNDGQNDRPNDRPNGASICTPPHASLHAPRNRPKQNQNSPESFPESLIGQLVSETADVLGAYHAQAQIENNSAHIEIARLLISTFMFHLQAHDDVPQVCDALRPEARPEWRALSLNALESSCEECGVPSDVEV